MKVRTCLYYYKNYYKQVLYCWMKPKQRRTLNICRNCLIAGAQREGKRTPLSKKPKWAQEAPKE